MAGLNRASLIGHLGADPEIRSLNSGDRVANLRLATSESWKDSRGERQERTEWHRITVFNENLVDVLEKYARKGSKLYIEGKIETRKWTDRDDVERYSTEIVLRAFGATVLLLDSAKDDRDDREDDRRGRSNTGRSNGRSSHRRDDDDRDGFQARSSRGNDTFSATRTGARHEFTADLDDEIPF